MFFCQGANSSFFTLFLAHGNNATINFCSQDCKSCQFRTVSLDITSKSEISTSFWRLRLNIFKTNSYVTGYFHRSTRTCKATHSDPHNSQPIASNNIYLYVTIVNLFSFHIGNMSQEKCHEKSAPKKWNHQSGWLFWAEVLGTLPHKSLSSFLKMDSIHLLLNRPPAT